jgi:transcriptional regulator of acetoin/glycerol metabolism
MKLKAMKTTELHILTTVYPERGSRGVRELLPHGSVETVHVMAWRLGLKAQPGSERRFSDDTVRAALEAANWSTGAAAAALGCSRQLVWLAHRRMRTAATTTKERWHDDRTTAR